MTINTQIKWFGLLNLCSVTGLELVLDHALMRLAHWSGVFTFEKVPTSILFYFFVLLFTFSLFANRKHLHIKLKKLKEMLKTLIKNTVSGNLLDIAFVLFFILHLTWIPDSIFEWIRGEYGFYHPMIYLSGLLLVIIFKPHYVKEDITEPIILLTGISNINVHPQNLSNTLDTLMLPVKTIHSIKKIIVFIDPRIKIELPDPRLEYQEEDEKLSKIEQYLKEETQKEVILVKCSYEIIQATYETISKEIDKILDDCYSDKHLLFNLTPGNKYISIALALNSIRSDRHCCYIQQTGENTNQIVYETLDVYKLRDIFTEITD